MRSTPVRVALAVALLSAPLAFIVSPSSASPTQASTPSVRTVPYVLDKGETKPVYSYAKAIRESVWVKAPDGDGDGKKDLITVDIVRPRELDGKAKVPVIIVCGKREAEERSVNIRRLGQQNQQSMGLDAAVAALVDEAEPPDLKRGRLEAVA